MARYWGDKRPDVVARIVELHDSGDRRMTVPEITRIVGREFPPNPTSRRWYTTQVATALRREGRDSGWTSR